MGFCVSFLFALPSLHMNADTYKSWCLAGAESRCRSTEQCSTSSIGRQKWYLRCLCESPLPLDGCCFEFLWILIRQRSDAGHYLHFKTWMSLECHLFFLLIHLQATWFCCTVPVEEAAECTVTACVLLVHHRKCSAHSSGKCCYIMQHGALPCLLGDHPSVRRAVLSSWVF